MDTNPVYLNKKKNFEAGVVISHWTELVLCVGANSSVACAGDSKYE
jgi:hypothetical protein